MARLIIQTQVSIDGYMGAPDGDLQWLLWHWQADWPWDEDLRTYHRDLLTSCRVALLSGTMMRGPGFLDHWADVATRTDDPQHTFARAIIDADKVGFSRSPATEVTWPNTRYATRPLREEVTALKQQAPTDIIAWGGSGFVQSLLRENLVDEVHLLVNPTALGDGLPVFPAGHRPRPFHLLDATPYPCGVILQRYTAAGA